MNKDLMLKKDDRVYCLGKNDDIWNFVINDSDGKTIKEFECLRGMRITKIERPKYETIYEVKEILAEKEKEYLSNVIRPFRDRVEYIVKCEYFDVKRNWININLTKNEDISLPFFYKNTMYKGMEIDKEYTLEELGL